jgi:hypothetical protein
MAAAWDACRQRLLPALQRAGDAGGTALTDVVQRRLEAQLASHAGQVPRATKFRRRQGGVAMLNQCPAMKSKDRLQRIAKVNVG